MFHSFVAWMSQTVGQWGYPGIVLLMALESSFFPFPSEVVIPPAAYLATKGTMNIGMVVFCGLLGSLAGAVFNYWIALKFGRPFFTQYGRYLLINSRTLGKADRFFEKHGYISIFVGRLLPGIRQYISLPAGLARMNLFSFVASTALGAGIWVTVLAAIGYLVGRNEELVIRNLRWVTLILVMGCAVVLAGYWIRWQRRSRLQGQNQGGGPLS